MSSQDPARPPERGPADDPRLAHAWDHFYEYCSAVINECPGVRRLSAHDREDCAQDVMIEIVRRFSAHRPGSAPAELTGLIRVLSRNKAADIIRRRYRRPEVPFEDGLGASVLAAGSPDPEHEPSFRNEDVSLVWEALISLDQKVSPTSYLVFYLRTIEGWSIAEVAALFQISPEQARARCHRVKAKFRSILKAVERRRGPQPS
jgi:RNA polymerase sigma factor (sigma-70 family)